MLPDQTLPAVNTNQDIEQVCNNLPPKELNDFLLEQLFYARQHLYYLDGSIFARYGNHLEVIPDSKLESLVLSVLNDKFRLIGKRSRVKSVADLIRLRDPSYFTNILSDYKVVAFRNGLLDIKSFCFCLNEEQNSYDFDLTKFNCKYELNIVVDPNCYFQNIIKSSVGRSSIILNDRLSGLQCSYPTLPFPDFCFLYNKTIGSGVPRHHLDGGFTWLYNIETLFYCTISNYITKSPTPVADKFFFDIANGDLNIVERIYQMIGYILVPGNDAKAYFLLQGESNSGKSILGKFLEGYFPPELVTSLDISRLGGQYLPDALSTSCLNLSMDLPNGKMSDKSVAVLKMLTGDDIITHEVKYKDAKPYRNKCKFVFSTNITIKALYLYYVLRENGFRFSGNDHLKPKVTYQMDPNDIIKSFFKAHCEITYNDNDFVSTADLYNEYLAFCNENGMQALSSMPGFSQRLMYLYSPKISSGRENNFNGYCGLKLYKSPVIFTN